jgi:hypothetical protein
VTQRIDGYFALQSYGNARREQVSVSAREARGLALSELESKHKPYLSVDEVTKAKVAIREKTEMGLGGAEWDQRWE